MVFDSSEICVVRHDDANDGDDDDRLSFDVLATLVTESEVAKRLLGAVTGMFIWEQVLLV